MQATAIALHRLPTLCAAVPVPGETSTSSVDLTQTHAMAELGPPPLNCSDSIMETSWLQTPLNSARSRNILEDFPKALRDANHIDSLTRDEHGRERQNLRFFLIKARAGTGKAHSPTLPCVKTTA